MYGAPVPEQLIPPRASATAAYQPVGVVPRLVRAATGAASNLPLDAEAGR